jgi:uncharacterized phage protein gp47/JayE
MGVEAVRGTAGAGTAQPGLQEEYRAALLARLRERRRRRAQQMRKDGAREQPAR